MIRKKKNFSRPRKAFDIVRIKAENELLKKYGLKNKKEIWKAEAAVGKVRNLGKKLITADREEQEKLFNKLNKWGLKVKTISDILGLDKEAWLKRRLQSIIISKNLAKPKEARQLIAHKHVAIDGKIINVPSYVVEVDEENKIQVLRKIKPVKEEIVEVQK